MITGINESKTLKKHILCEGKCKVDVRKCNSDQQWNNDKCRCECKKRHVREKKYVWNTTTRRCENGKYLASIMDDSAIICDEVIKSYEETKTILANSNEKKVTCNVQNFYILITFLLITIVLLIAVSIYRYLIKYQANQKHLLPFQFTNNKLKEIIYQNYEPKMSNKVKDKIIKNRTYYFFDDIINIKIFDLSNIQIDEKFIYYIKYERIKDSEYVKINSVNSLYLFFQQRESIL